EAYMAYDLSTTNLGFLGFYFPPTNRSAFFNMMDWPPMVQIVENARQKGIDGAERMKRENFVKRYTDQYNLEVVQHEASHHIHFNIGLFNPRAPYGRWITEGMATMFEAPETSSGASLGTINYKRLRDVRQYIGGKPEKLPPGFLSRFL